MPPERTIRCHACGRSNLDSAAVCGSCGAAFVLTTFVAPPQRGDTTVLAPGRVRAVREPAASVPAASADGGFAPGTILLRRYRIVALAGRGAMGEVYRADDLKLGQSVALKFLPVSLNDDPARFERFMAEARLARQITHPCVCRVHDVGDLDGRHYLSMEYVDGEALSSLLRRIGALPLAKGLEISRQICAALGAAHERGIVHRDLKPDNIMIDGRGCARLADFGLAVIAADLQGRTEIAGTPAYMSPEQLDGRELSTRSDLYALGLVLYEIFTGQKLIPGGSLSEMRDARRSAPARVAARAADLNPQVTGVIAACLAEDPRERPADALSIAAALPGGDLLSHVSIEPPSIDQVAAAGAMDRVKPAMAWPLFAAALAAIAVAAWIVPRGSQYAIAPLTRSPDVLVDRATQIAARCSAERAVGSASGWMPDTELLAFVRDRDRSARRWDLLANGRPAAMLFWYRQSPEPLVSVDVINRISLEDPPFLVPGMLNVVVDGGGRLQHFETIPRHSEGNKAREGAASSTPIDWTAFFADAGLDASRFSPIEPFFVPAYADERRGWRGVLPDTDIPIEIDAAAHHGAPVYFSLRGPWQGHMQIETRLAAATRRFSRLVLLIVNIVALAGGFVLARRQLRAGRADRVGAWRLAIYALGLTMVQWAFGNDHTRSVQDEWTRVTVALGQSLFVGVFMWIVYIALEPLVRRQWPHVLISWARAMRGAWTDPLVGRDILLGVLGGAVLAIVCYAQFVMPRWIGWTPPTPALSRTAVDVLGSARQAVAALAAAQHVALLQAIFLITTLVILRLAVKRQWMANVLMTAIGVGLLIRNGESPALEAVVGVLYVGAAIAILLRVGFLALFTALCTFYMLEYFPMTFDPGSWYAGRSVTALIALAAIATFGLTVSLRGRSTLAFR